ncbi:hypothetical protein J7T55_010167 [Diaporthe amygdali]|uniref:uncharacterized protein n=1 Tax=Phomopsis amygdali TaxID=1214568 RepID=UPI0022FE68CB|nr:uncharacterized protein J7T55_010167 [Diaporthe amygdali]KAJ0113923.1 hypothetical protein J7T55_010167 [Diaporthe amygdali]
MSSRSRRSSRVLPPAPELDSLGLEDEDRDSSPHRSSRDRDRDRARGRGRGRDGDTRTMDRLVLRDREWERRQDEEILMQTPDSRASSSSRRLSRHYHSDPRGRQPTPPHSVSSSRASTRVPHPPMSSMTRPSTAEVLYRRPSLREPIRAGYDDQDPGHGLRRARSHARSIHAAPSVPVLRDSMYASGSESNGTLLLSTMNFFLRYTHARALSPEPHLLGTSQNQMSRNQKTRKTTTIFVIGLSAEENTEIDTILITRRNLEEDEAKATWSPHQRPSDKRVKIVECVVCMDDLPSRKTAKLKCGHRMCHSCLKRSFKLSITDPQHMPPKCCTAATIPLKHVDRLFDNEFKRTWNKKFVEYSTRNRIYCPKKGCSEFIRPEDIRHADDGRKYGRCDKCKTKVCVRCNGRWHNGRDCPKDEDTVMFLAQAKEEGWQCCFRCKAMVELKEGCNHMTCRCGAEFCMICGARWKTCECSWFNYDSLEDDRLEHMQIPFPARDRVGGRPAVDIPPSPTRQARAGPGISAFPGPRPRPQNYEEELHLRRLQDGRDEAYARRLQTYQESEDGPEDDFLGGFGDIHGLGNAASHHMNDNFRPRPRHIVVPEPPQPSPLPQMPIDPAPAFDRAATGDYIRGVNRARGVRAASVGRLADRFNTDLRQSPMHRPPPLPTAATMPLPALASAVPPGPGSAPIRRHTVETGEVYDDDRYRPRSGGTRPVERVITSGRTARSVFHEEPEDMLTQGVAAMKQHIRDPPKASNLAGLTGSGRGADRVWEWATHVQPGPGPDASA